MLTRDRILVTVKTYPELSKTYGETVCTAGIREDGTWVRLYPVPFRRLDEGEQYKLYDWITCPLAKHSRDPRPESHRPTGEIERVDHVGTADNWRERRELLLGRPRVYGSLGELIEAAKNNISSLAVFKPARLIDFEWEPADREWDASKLEAVRTIASQPDLFDDESWNRTFRVVDKVPYNFYYRVEDADGRESRMRILEWQLGALYRNCLRSAEGDETKPMAHPVFWIPVYQGSTSRGPGSGGEGEDVGEAGGGRGSSEAPERAAEAIRASSETLHVTGSSSRFFVPFTHNRKPARL